MKDYWYIEVRDNSPKDVIIAIVGNKSDKYEFEEVNEDEVKEFCNSIHAIYKLTSAALGEGINELFDMIGHELLSSESFDTLKKNSFDSMIRLKSPNSIYTSISTVNDEYEDQNIKIQKRKKKKCC